MRRRLPILLVLMLVATACASVAPSGTAPTARVVVRNGKALEPAVLEVKAGDRVQWVNEAPGGDVIITFARGAMRFDSSPSRPVYTFVQPGRYEYVATATSIDTGGTQFITKLRGEIVVKEAAVAGAPPPDASSPRRDIVRVRDAREAMAAYGYQAAQGVVVRAERGLASPGEVRAGEPVVLQTQYSVLSPPDRGTVPIKETWIIIHNDQELGRLDRETALGPGTYSSQQRLVLPEDAPAGTYLVRARVEALSPGRAPVSDQTAIRFVIRPR